VTTKSSQLKLKDQQFEIQNTSSKYSIILGKLIEIVNIVRRPMLTGGFADEQKRCGADINDISPTSFIFRNLHFWRQPKLYLKDIELHIWGTFGKLVSAWMCCFNSLCERRVLIHAWAVCSVCIFKTSELLQ